MGRRLACYLSGVMFLLVIPTIWNQPRPDIRPLAFALIFLFGVTWLIASLWSKGDFSLPKLILPLTAYLGLEALLLATTPLPVYGLYWMLAGWMGLLVFGFIVEQATRGWERMCWENLLICLGVIFALVDLLFYITWYILLARIYGSFWNMPAVSLRSPGMMLGQPNLLAGYINLVIPLVVVRVLRTKQLGQRLAWLSSLSILLVVLYFTSSRAGLLGCAASLATMAMLSIAPSLTRGLRDRQWHFPSIPRQRWILGVGILALVGLVVIPWVVRYAINVERSPTSYRMSIWLYALQQIAASPIYGKGPGQLAFLYALRREGLGVDEVFHAHNIWLQIGATTGIVGLILVLWMTYLLVRAWINAWREYTGMRIELAAYSGILAGVVIHGMFDYLLSQPVFLMAVFALLGSFYTLATHADLFRVRRVIFLPALAGFVVAGALGGVIYLRGFPAYSVGLAAAQRDDWHTARQELCQAAQENPRHTFFSFQCALASATLFDLSGDPVALQDAIDFQRRGLAQDPYWFPHWHNLATFEWQNGERDQAVKDIRQAVVLAPNDPYLWATLAWMSEETGRPTEAGEAYRMVACLQPAYRETRFFQKTELRKEAGRATCPNMVNNTKMDLLNELLKEGKQVLEINDLAAAEQLFQKARNLYPQQPLPYSYLAQVHQALGLEEQAWAEAQAGVFMYNESSLPYILAAQVAFEQGRETEGMDYFSRAFDLITHNKRSLYYYYQVYSLPPLPNELSPFWLRIDLDPNTRQLLLKYAKLLEAHGQTQEATKVLEWLEAYDIVQ